MVLSDKILFDSIENWAAATAKGFMMGRDPMEDRIGMLDFVSKVSWKSPPGIPDPPLPNFKEVGTQSTPEATAVSAGSWQRALSLPVSDNLAKLLHIPRSDPSAKHIAKVVSVNSKERVDISDIPTCTTKGIFDKTGKGQFPSHPTITFAQPVGRVHVQVTDRSKHFLWDATYDLKGDKVLNDSSELISSESLVPGFIPPCSISAKSFLSVSIDAEIVKGDPETLVLNPVGTLTTDQTQREHSDSLPVERPLGHRELRSTDAILCKIQKGLSEAKPLPVNVLGNRDKVVLPPKYAHALWRIDRGREEASDLNPRGIPMHEMIDRSREPPSGLSSQMKELGPVSIGSGQFIPRRPMMNGEISVVQLEKGNLGKIFDSRSLTKDPFLADRSVILQRPAGNNQFTVDRTLFSSMWQGVHDKHSPLHPSVEFKHPVSYARLQLIDLEKKRFIWDALFDVKGNHKIAVDQKPIGGSNPDFNGVSTTPPGKPHWYILRVDADNPKDIPADSAAPIRYWRQSQFVFGVKKQFVHADAVVEVTNKSNFAIGGTQIIKS